ncbi:unnamed protein product [Hydatigera taeniaeformis]|uniref:Aldehyde dehydrogenase domain-containing protein n=1 Tax=Hydatigena taeniaeformis TaxID=6205 RepID=A0A3P7FLL8_HYDTA|nr:unnamed protein product [Hydatigera taeniaeformis]
MQDLIFINNKFVNSLSGKTFGVVDPSTEKEVCCVAEGDAADIDSAVKAARAAFLRDSPWRCMDASQRGRLLYRLADALAANVDYLSQLEALDAGKPLESARGDVDFAIDTVRYYAGYADKIHGKVVIPCNGDVICYTRREPVGVVGAIIPWNYPLDLIAMKVAPALCAGCCIIVKPAEETPLSALFFAHLVEQIGFPPGVVNVVPGFGETAGAALASHPDVDAVTFTGSTAVGHSVMLAGAGTFKRVNLELGGKSPLIIFADADLDKAASVAFEGVMENAGQCCVAATRTFVEASVYEEMLERFKRLAEQRVVGDPFKSGVEQGPQVLICFALSLVTFEEGARLVAGGRRLGDKGFYIAPTVFGDVRDDMRIASEEIFGPVQVVLQFHDIEEVIQRANSSHYGLGGGVFTTDMDKAFRVAQALEAGTVWFVINSYNTSPVMQPFGGYKHSGVGRENGKDGLKFFTEIKTVSMPISKKNS